MSYKPLTPEQLAHSDIDVELAKAKHMAEALDLFIKLIEPKSVRTTDTVCCKCGRRLVLAGAQDPNGRWVCTDCSTGDRPTYRPDTGL